MAIIMGRFGDKLVKLKVSESNLPQYFEKVFKEISNGSAQVWNAARQDIHLVGSEKISPTEAKFTTRTSLGDEIYVELTCVAEKGGVTVYWQVTFSSHQMGSGMVIRMFKSKYKKDFIAALEFFDEK